CRVYKVVERRGLEKYILSKDSVSAVIGVILMVAVTVAVVGVLYSYISVFQPTSAKPVSAFLEIDYKNGKLTIQHLGGDKIYNAIYAPVAYGLILHLDASNPNSYPGTGSYWYSLVGSTVLTNTGLSYTSVDGVKCFDFDGSHYFHGPGTGVPMDDAFTLELWYYHEGLSERDTIFEKQGTTYPSYKHEIACTLETSNRMSYYWGHSPNYDYGGTPSMSTGSWHQIIVTREHGGSGNKKGHAYIDTSDSGYYYVSRATEPIVPTTGEIRIGYGYAGPVESGYISIVRVYNRVLTLEEIKTNYDSFYNSGWRNLEVRVNGELVDVKNVTYASPDFGAGDSIIIYQNLKKDDVVTVIYKPAGQLLKSYIVP
ncbi:MAG TPA: type IV pilin, partial [Thermoplasmatales archaeon]|nr:type IV pilin [Thermoplasmatales archaeon]HEX08512.1 type IV pilin [Thermoplasmatales archaeon]